MKSFFIIVFLLLCFVPSPAGAGDTGSAAVARLCNTAEACLPLAESGDIEAQLRLGLIHSMQHAAFLMSEDRLRTQNLQAEAEEARKSAESHGKEVLKWLEMAAKQGDVRAFAQLGRLYARGEMVIKDDSKAAAYYTKAARVGDWPSQHQLGEFYFTGRGVERNYLMAYAWLNCALKTSATQKGSGTASKRERMEYLLSVLSEELSAAQMADAQKLADAYILDYVALFQSIGKE